MQDKKKLSVMIPCFNEVENIVGITKAVTGIIETKLPAYDYEVVIIDNASTDGTRDKIREICKENEKVKAIFNVTNFGQFSSPFHGMCQTTGDCTITMCADFQDPPELIPQFVEKWEQGHKIVSGVKTSSKENPILYKLRSIYYKLIKAMSSVDMIEHFTGFGLYDKSFIKLLRELKDPMPFVRGIVAEYASGFNLAKIEYQQPQRSAGTSKNNFFSLYDAAMLSFTSYTKFGLRIATFIGGFVAAFSVLAAIVLGIYKLLNMSTYFAGYAPLMIAIFFWGGVNLAFIGYMGEYIISINQRVINRPVVVEEERINF